MKYSPKFKQKMVAKMVGPDARSARSLSLEAGIAQATLSRWLREAKVRPMVLKSPTKEQSRRGRWSPDDKVRVVLEAAALDDATLGAFLRREGLHESDLVRFREEVREAATDGLRAKASRGRTPEQKENDRLRKELARKDRALAETAALLVLQGKARAFFASEGEEGDTNNSSGR